MSDPSDMDQVNIANRSSNTAPDDPRHGISIYDIIYDIVVEMYYDIIPRYHMIWCTSVLVCALTEYDIIELYMISYIVSYSAE